MNVMLLAALLIGIARQGVDCYSRGAPSRACVNLQPDPESHGDPQTTKVPYGINMSQFHNDSISGFAYIPDKLYICKCNCSC